MKNYLIAVGILFVSFCYSQPQTLQSRSGGGTMSILHPEDEGYTGDEIEGSPYIMSDYMNAIVSDSDSKLVKMRYNAFTDTMEFERGGVIYDLDPEIHKEVSFEGLNKKYVYSTYPINNKMQKGFLLQVYKGNNFTFYRKEQIEFKQKKQATTSFQQDIPAKYTRKKDTYYLKLKNENIIELPNSKNKIVELVENKKAVNDYIKKNNLSISEESDLVILFKYMDTL